MNLLKALAYSLLIAASLSRVLASEDLGENAGYLTGSIVSNSAYPWYPLSEEGPGGMDSILSGTPFQAGDTSEAELTLVGPGILTFQWHVDSVAGDGWLTCDLWNSVNKAETAGITGSGAGWQRIEMFIPQGSTKVVWSYRKNSSTFEAFLEDAGRLADVDFTPLPTAIQTFEDWKAAQGGSGTGAVAPNGLQFFSCWAMGLDPEQPVPIGLNTPVTVGDEVRFRVRYNLAANILMTPAFSADLASWSMRGVRSRRVTATQTAQTVDFDYYFPVSSKGFFRCNHPPIVTPPAEYAYIPPGVFVMCSPGNELGRRSAENFQHQVTLTKGIFIKRHETTLDEWNSVKDWARLNNYPDLGYKDVTVEGNPVRVEMGAPGGRLLAVAEGGDVTGSGPSLNGEGNQPVTNISWYETLKWLNAKSEKEGYKPCYSVRLTEELGGQIVVFRNQRLEDIANAQTSLICDWQANGYRLPTEAEWEFACRGRTTTALNNGFNLTYGSGQQDPLDPNVDPVAWYYANGAQSRPVGTKLPNSFGLYDMHGNAMEWCWDLVDDTLATAFQPTPVTDPRGQTARGIYRAMRGGSWRNSGANVRSAFRDRQIGTLQGGYQVGFRIARNSAQ